jgi:hypothetical protein
MSPAKAYHIKLPAQFKERFTKPYDSFLTKLIGHTTAITIENIQTCLKQRHGPNDWLLWLNLEDRSKFINARIQRMPTASHSQFVEALLQIHESNSPIRRYRPAIGDKKKKFTFKEAKTPIYKNKNETVNAKRSDSYLNEQSNGKAVRRFDKSVRRFDKNSNVSSGSNVDQNEIRHVHEQRGIDTSSYKINGVELLNPMPLLDHY